MAVHDAITYYLQNVRLGDARLLFCGFQDCPPAQFNTPHVRPYYLLVYILSGKGVFHTAQASYALDAGCTFCIFPDEVIDYQADAHDPWTYYWIAFDGTLNGSSMDALLLRASISPSLPIHRTHHPELFARLYAQAFDLCQQPAQFSDLKIASLFLDILHHYIILPGHLSPAAFSAPHLSPYIVDALRYIRQHAHEDISVADIAAFLGLSREYFSTLFSRTLHTPPSVFLRDYRLKLSIPLLMTTDDAITVIAHRVGFHDYCYFANQFHARFGVTPGQYRRFFRIGSDPNTDNKKRQR